MGREFCWRKTQFCSAFLKKRVPRNSEINWLSELCFWADELLSTSSSSSFHQRRFRCEVLQEPVHNAPPSSCQQCILQALGYDRRRRRSPPRLAPRRCSWTPCSLTEEDGRVPVGDGDRRRLLLFDKSECWSDGEHVVPSAFHFERLSHVAFVRDRQRGDDLLVVLVADEVEFVRTTEHGWKKSIWSNHSLHDTRWECLLFFMKGVTWQTQRRTSETEIFLYWKI